MSTFSNFILEHQNIKNIFVIGGGPSLQDVNLDLLDATKDFIITCNQAFLLFPHAKITHHSDYNWWTEYKNKLDQNFKGEFITGCGLGNTLSYPDSVIKLNLAHQENSSRLFSSFEYIYGNNSGLQALSIAHLFLPKNIILIGFDFTTKENQTHGYEKSDNKSSEHYSTFWKMFLKNFREFEKLRQQNWHLAHSQVDLPKIWNVNPNSALKLYDQSKTLIDFL